MKKALAFIAATLLMLLIVRSLQAAEPQIKAGSKAVFYSFTGLSQVGIDGSSIGGEYFFVDKMAVFTSLSFLFKNTDPDDRQKETSDDLFGVGGGFMWYAFQKGSVSFYFGPQVYYENRRDDVNDGDVSYQQTEISVDVGCSLSVEWWATESISFWGGTFVGFRSTNGTRDFGATKSDYTSTAFGFIDPGSRIGIGFYF